MSQKRVSFLFELNKFVGDQAHNQGARIELRGHNDGQQKVYAMPNESFYDNEVQYDDPVVALSTHPSTVAKQQKQSAYVHYDNFGQVAKTTRADHDAENDDGEIYENEDPAFEVGTTTVTEATITVSTDAEKSNNSHWLIPRMIDSAKNNFAKNKALVVAYILLMVLAVAALAVGAVSLWEAQHSFDVLANQVTCMLEEIKGNCSKINKGYS